MVDRTSRQIHHLDAGRRDARVAGGIGESQHRVGVGHVEIVAHQHHAERRVQPFQQHRAQVRHSVTIGVAQQRDAVGAGHTSARPFHHQAHQPTLDALGVFGLGRSVGLRHQHIAVGQHMQPARVVQAAGERGHARARRRLRRRTGRPTLGGRDIHGRNQRLPWWWQRGLWPRAGRDRQRGHLTAGGECQNHHANQRGARARSHPRLTAKRERPVMAAPSTVWFPSSWTSPRRCE